MRRKKVKEETDVKEIIKEFIETKWSDADSKGKGVELLKGIAYSDDPAAEKFMQDLDELSNTMEVSKYTDTEEAVENSKRYKVIELQKSLKVGNYLLEKGDKIALPIKEQMNEYEIAVPQANVDDVQEYLDNIGVNYREEGDSDDYYRHVDMILDFDESTADQEDTLTELENFYSVKLYDTMGVI